MQASLDFVSVGCNQTPHSADWNSNGLLAFAAGNSVAFACMSQGVGGVGRVVAMLHGHTDRVNCVAWTSYSGTAGESPNLPPFLLSGAADGHIIVWKCVDTRKSSYELDEVVSGHDGSVLCLVGMTCSSTTAENTTTIVSAGSDSILNVWQRSSSEEKFGLLQNVALSSGFVFGVDLFCLRGHLVLACGTDTGKVVLYVKQDKQDSKFEKRLSLDGHEDWVKDVHFTREGSGCLLASCSQDTYIRLWRLFREAPDSASEGGELKLTENSFSLEESDKEQKYIVTLESVLVGHEDRVYSVRWCPQRESELPSLLSSSMDKTMVLWSFDEESGLWIEQVRVGDVGGNFLGLYGAVFAPGGDAILAHGHQGEFHLWKKVTLDRWVSVPTVSGHYGPVQDISWEPTRGAYLLSVSSDQTTRAYGPCLEEGEEESRGTRWCEIARPQIHGYDMVCVRALTPVLFISAADEKLLRVFHCPRNFIDNLWNVSKVKFDLEHEDFPSTATVPSLGLSNKAEFSTDIPINLSAVATNSSSSPAKGTDQLQNTLWPEIHKLYGHSYEIFCIASSPDGKLVASASIASKQEYATILLWDTSHWHQIQSLVHHSLTVTQLAFSHSSQFLLAVSRDRTWSLWRRNNDGSFCLSAKVDKSIHSVVHSRIIWSCCWTHDDKYFATGSRDKKVCFWWVCNEGTVKSFGSLQFSDAVTAVSFAPFSHQNKYLLAVGLESGKIAVYGCVEGEQSLKCDVLTELNSSYHHTAAVKKLVWRPCADRISLASCSLDHCVKVFTFSM